MLIRTLLTTLFHIFCKSILNFHVIVKSIVDPDIVLKEKRVIMNGVKLNTVGLTEKNSGKLGLFFLSILATVRKILGW